MSDALLEVDGVTKRFGGFTALDAVSVAIRPGERFGLVGPNGSGKTTLINCISGALSLEAGRISSWARNLDPAAYVRTRRGIARSFQIPRPFKSMTVVENLMVALDFVGSDMDSAKASDTGGDGAARAHGACRQGFRPSSELTRSSCGRSSWPAPWPRARSC